MSSIDALSHEVLHLPLWLLRLANNESVMQRLQAQAMTFAAWYAVMQNALSWPDEVVAIQQTERSRELSFERALDLLEKMNLAFRGQTDLERARDLLEAYAVHEWVRRSQKVFEALVQESLKQWEDIRLEDAREGSKLQELVSALSFSPQETQLLTMAVLCTASTALDHALTSLIKERAQLGPLWSCMFACSSQALEQALSPNSALVRSRLLAPTDAKELTLKVSPFWVKALQGVERSLVDALTQPLALRAGAGMPAQLSEADEKLATELMQNAKESGVNLLLYGADGLDRRFPVGRLLEAAQKKGFVVQAEDVSWRDVPTVHFVAQRLLYLHHKNTAVLVVERSGEVLDRRPSDFLLMLTGGTFDAGSLRPFDDLMLSENPAPCIWVGPGADRLAPECVARFVFHAPLARARRQERQRYLEQTLQELKLSAAVRKQLLEFEDISALQLQTAMRAARLSGAANKKDREAYLLQAVKRSLAALQRDTRPAEKECVTQYSLKYVNYAGRFGPEQILKSFKTRPKGSLCLYGPPGTGKTQFVEYLARELGLRLKSFKASDLLSKYVGENEQNIAKMFQEASAEDHVLFLDEADSFLRDRTLAQHSWEVTKVNELLQHMERFEGIFVVATNLFDQLDLAALRRFTFKLEFQALRAEQRWEMFVNETGLKGQLGQHSSKLREDWQTELVLMPKLTAGDFAVVKRQAMLLGETLTPDQWLEQLKMECELKSRAH